MTKVLAFAIASIVFVVLFIASFFVKKKLEARSLPMLSPNGEGPEKMYDAAILGVSTQMGNFKRNGCDGKQRICYEGTVILGIPVEFKRCYLMEMIHSNMRYEAPNMKYSFQYKVYGTQFMNKAEILFMILRPIVVWGVIISICGLLTTLYLL